MLQFKDSEILNNIALFETGKSTNITSMWHLIKSLKLGRYLPTPKQSKYSRSYSLTHMILLFLLGSKNVCQYKNGVYSKLIECGKDVLYRICSKTAINWRSILYTVNMGLLKRIEDEEESTKSPSCFIVDDTDLEKTGRKIEFIGMIWSHVVNRPILGFKSLNLCYWTGSSLLALDFSLHLEKGKNKSKPQGLKKKTLKERFRKLRNPKSPGFMRTKELWNTKIEMSIKMIKRAVKKGITARYVLMDSWFCCEQIIEYVKSVPQLDLICRAKMNKTKYLYKNKLYTAKELKIKFQYRQSHRKYSRKLKRYYVLLKVEYKGIPVKLLLVQSNKTKWIVILTTERKASAVHLIETYQIRWTIEVFFKQAKQHLGLGKNQSIDFDSQIANTTLTLIRYNLLCALKYGMDNITIGTLFRRISEKTPRVTVVDRIIQLFYKIRGVVSELFDIDVDQVLEKILSSSRMAKNDSKLLAYIVGIETCET